jgi:hypothetical protein
MSVDEILIGGSQVRIQFLHERNELVEGQSWRDQSAWIAKANKRVQFGYGLNYLIDLGPMPSSSMLKALPLALTMKSRQQKR